MKTCIESGARGVVPRGARRGVILLSWFQSHQNIVPSLSYTIALFKFVDFFLDSDSSNTLPPTEDIQQTVEQFNSFSLSSLRKLIEFEIKLPRLNFTHIKLWPIPI